jgi:hypothetical protein
MNRGADDVHGFRSRLVEDKAMMLVAVVEVGFKKSRRGRTRRLTKTLRGCGDPSRGRWRGDSLGRPCAGTVKMTAYSTLQSELGSVAVGRESVQRCDLQQRMRLGRRVGSWRHGPKTAALRPDGTMQRQPDARSTVGACSGTCLA